MRKLLFSLGFLGSFFLIHAQQASSGFLLSGEVIYQEIVKMDIKLEGVDEQLAAQIPKERKSEKVLYFNEHEAIFENLPKEDPEEGMPMEGGGMMIKMYQPDDKSYLDLAGEKMIEQKEFMSRVFLIESELKQDKWKMTGQQRMILEYPCQEAVTQVEGKEVHAWFTPQIAVAAGPGRYSGLPGLVLAMEMDDGDRTLTAIKLELKPVEKGAIQKPRKGKKVTREEYQAIVAEKMKEMGVEAGDGGTASTHSVVIRIQQ